MATYYVAKTGNNSNNGSTGSPWLTLTYAASQIGSGDTVRVRAGTYTETLRIAKTNATFIADNPNDRPIIDGGYHAGLMSAGAFGMNTTLPRADAGFIGNGPERPFVSLAANGVTLDGFVVQNIAGRGIGLGGNNTTVKNCSVFWTFGGGIVSNPGDGTKYTGLTIQDNDVYYASVMLFEPNRLSYTNCNNLGQCVEGGIKVGNNNGNTLIKGNTVAYCFGEGINIGKVNRPTANTPIVVEGNTIHDCNHVHIYTNDTLYTHIRNNILYCSNAPLNIFGNGAPTGIRLLDEISTGQNHIKVYNNLLVNLGQPLYWGARYTASVGVYFGYNTVVGGPQSGGKPAKGSGATIGNAAALTIVKQVNGGTANQKGVVENCLIDYSMTTKPVYTGNNVLGEAGAALRNNVWSSSPGANYPNGPRSSSDIIGDPKLVNPTAVLATTNYLTRANTTWASLTVSDNFNADNYRLRRDSPAIGAAAGRQARWNNTDIPTFTTDLAGATRDDQDAQALEFWDCGCYEYGASITDPEDAVTASFTQSKTSGRAPLQVTFTNTSTADGDAVINSLVYYFGDGTSTDDGLPAVTYFYTQPGVYTPYVTVKDTVRGLQSTAYGDPITVTPADTGTTPAYFDVVRTTLPTTAADKTIQFAMGGYAPSLVLFFLTNATTAGTAANGAMLAYGAVTATGQWVHVVNSNHGNDPTETEKYSSQARCLAVVDEGAVIASASRKALAADRITIECSAGFPAGALLTAVAIGGAQYEARLGKADLGVAGEKTILTPGFYPELYLFAGGGVSTLGTVENNADFIFGAADDATQYGYSWRDVDAQATTRIRASISTEGVAIRQARNTGIARFTNYGLGELTVGKNDIQRSVLYAALNLAGNAVADVKQFTSPTSTGAQSYSLGYRPVGVIILMPRLDIYDAHSSVDAEGFAIIAADANSVHCVGIASKHGAAATASLSRVDNDVTVIDGDGAVQLAGALTFNDNGIAINWTTVEATARPFNVIAIGGQAPLAGPIPQFSASTTTPVDGVVQFYDLSAPNGSAITSWEWDFGDENNSTEQNPEHTYTEPGVYTVSLTVTNANGSDTITKVNYIAYAPSLDWFVGPYESRSVTNESVNKLYGDDEYDFHYGYHEHELDLDGLEIDAYPEDTTTASAGKIRIVADLANGRLKIIKPNGTAEYLSFDA